MFSFLRGKAKQRNRELISDDGVGNLSMTRAQQLFTADWKKELLMAGYVYSFSPIAAAIAGGDETTPQVTGGGAGTVIDSDQPEIIVGCDAGYVMIPLEFHCSAKVDLDADTEVGNILLFADRTQAPPATATATTLTANNMLDGGPAFPGRAFHTVTADITDPVLSDLLVFETIREAEISAVSHVSVKLSAHYEPEIPHLLDGPCSVVACWGGTAAVTALAKLICACVPRERFLAAV